GKQDRVTPFGIPMDFDYCHTVSAPSQYTRGGPTYYFSHWRVKKESGSETDISSYANELPSHAYASTLTNPVTDVTAVYTDSPPDFLVRNTTVSAHLATAGMGGSPPPAVALKWQNKYDMDDVETTIEYERTSNNWVPLTFEHYLTRPEKVGIGQWTGVLITHVPASGGGKTEIRNDRSYRFRIVGDFNGNAGTPSAPAAITTRPADPALVYCADANEPNSQASPKVLPASGADMEEWTLDGAIPIQPIVGEFQFNVPDWDYFRIDVNDVSGSTFGERLVLRLRVKGGSNFKPRFRAQRVGESDHVGAYDNEGEYILVLLHEGTYIIKVESRVGGGAWNDIVHPTQGYFSFGEYEITLRRERLHIEPDVPELCVRCVKYTFENQPQPGQFVLTPHPKYELFRKGVPRDIPIMFNMYYQVPAGYSFQGFGGDLGTIRDNPATMQINENTDPREYRIHPIIAPIGDGGVELVVLHPEGPDGARENRQSTSPGSVLTATAQVPEGYDFAGWGGDTTAMTNPLPVTMWKSKRLIAYYRKKPCTPTPMTAWLHELSFRNAEQSRVTLEYGMQAGAGDGLEAGQTDLPPVPPPTAFDIRWLNIPGSQGSHTDHRAITASHVFQGQVQTGDKAPVTMEWTSPPVIPGARYTLNIQGGQGSIDMRTQNVYTFSSAGRYIFTIEVEEKGCPEPSKDNDLIVIVDDIDRTDWPCVDLKLKMRDRATGEPRPYADPFKIKVMERMEGTARPMRIDAVQQLDSLLIYRICTDPDDPIRDREIIVVNDNEDEEQREDTTVVNLDPPLPDGDGDPQRFVLRATGDWQMVSIPLDLQNASTSGLFTARDFAMYQFNTDAGTYDPVASMEMGRGYWLKGDPMEEVLVGRTRDALRWDDLSGIGEPYGYGWNMIGALHQSVAVSSIEQQPAGGLQSIFGWDPVQGYIVPTQIESGKGYWARVQPNTTLRIVSSGVASGSGTQTAYRRVVGSLDLAGMLVVANRHGHTRTLHVAADHLSESAARLLELPATPPAGVMDARTGRGSAFIFPGEETLRIRADGPCVIRAVDATSRMRLELRDEPLAGRRGLGH
ncbi:MAG: hypothetical protein RRA94_13005, partial [Bacteroidota bacterium]|nr:hypothetical protein [Bacteroidota bacterium]